MGALPKFVERDESAVSMVQAMHLRMPEAAHGCYAAWAQGSTVRAWVMIGDARVDFTHHVGLPDSVVITYADRVPPRAAFNAPKTWCVVDTMRYPAAEAGLDQFFAIVNLLLEQA